MKRHVRLELAPSVSGNEVGFNRLAEIEELVVLDQPPFEAVRLVFRKLAEEIAPQKLVLR